MKFNLIRYYSILFFVFIIAGTKAQDAYKAEIGPVLGSTFYLGDANNKLFANNSLSYGIVYRYKFNPRLALAGEWSYHTISGNYLSNNNTIIFNNTINSFDFTGEFNFFDLENKTYKPFSQKYSTFILAGIGGMLYPYEGRTEFMYHYTFGAGLKIMLGKRMNLNFKWTNSLLLTDQMEGVSQLNNKYNLNGSNILNNDLLSTINVSLTYNIFKERCNCNNNWR
jgi:hypothetical protein